MISRRLWSYGLSLTTDRSQAAGRQLAGEVSTGPGQTLDQLSCAFSISFL
jgi:hypothetical protein